MSIIISIIQRFNENKVSSINIIPRKDIRKIILILDLFYLLEKIVCIVSLFFFSCIDLFSNTY